MQGALPDLENGWAHCAQIWYAVRHRLVGCRASHFGPSLHVRSCRMPLPNLRNGRVDCLQIWHTASDRLVGCRAQSSWKYPLTLRHVQGSLSRLLVFRPKGVLLVYNLTILKAKPSESIHVSKVIWKVQALSMANCDLSCRLLLCQNIAFWTEKANL